MNIKKHIASQDKLYAKIGYLTHEPILKWWLNVVLILGKEWLEWITDHKNQ
jgi:hypothetical protein